MKSEVHGAPVGDCYSAGERGWMVRGQELRAVALGQLLRILSACKVTPDHLTSISLLFGLAFCPLFFASVPLALAALILHVLVDGLDGPLARHLGVASRRGSFTDTMADQIVVTATTITLMKAGLTGTAAGGIYIFVYGIVVAFAMIRNAMAIPYSWLLRPRFFVYGWMPIEFWMWSGTIEYVLWAASAVLGWKMLTGFYYIRQKL
ncbi:MAG: CDP-alcohol phosphatidyltransferase family protein [Limisphaerales bacterium]